MRRLPTFCCTAFFFFVYSIQKLDHKQALNKMKILHYLEGTMYQQNEHLASLENIPWILERWLLFLLAHPTSCVLFGNRAPSFDCDFHYTHER
jgi:hypothetical protein